MGLPVIFLMATFLPSLLLVFLHGAPFQLEKFLASRNPMTRPPEEDRIKHQWLWWTLGSSNVERFTWTAPPPPIVLPPSSKRNQSLNNRQRYTHSFRHPSFLFIKRSPRSRGQDGFWALSFAGAHFCPERVAHGYLFTIRKATVSLLLFWFLLRHKESGHCVSGAHRVPLWKHHHPGKHLVLFYRHTWHPHG